MKLALGTVQFGLRYGVEGAAAPVAEAEVRRILDCAWEGGVRMLDTAAAYGDIEQRLAGLCGTRPFRVVTKLAARPPVPGPAGIAHWVRESWASAVARFGESLHAVLLHRAEDLDGTAGPVVWSELEAARRGTVVKLGVSCYGPAELSTLLGSFPVGIAQLPANALDQRLLGAAPGAACELHLRSAFLQGLLLMDEAAAAARVPAARGALARWHGFCAAQATDPLVTALSVMKGFSTASHCVFGVYSVAQLEQVLRAWEAARPLSAPSLATEDPAVIDPRTWEART